MSPHTHMGLETKTQLCHPASMISVYRPTHSMCELLWQWYSQTNITAPNHWSRQIRFQFQRSQWTWVPLKAGKHHTQQRTMAHFTQRTSLDESIETFLPVTHLILTSPDQYPTLRAHTPHRRLHDNKRESRERVRPFSKRGGRGRSTHARHAASPYQNERHPKALNKLKH